MKTTVAILLAICFVTIPAFAGSSRADDNPLPEQDPECSVGNTLQWLQLQPGELASIQRENDLLEFELSLFERDAENASGQYWFSCLDGMPASMECRAAGLPAVDDVGMPNGRSIWIVPEARLADFREFGYLDYPSFNGSSDAEMAAYSEDERRALFATALALSREVQVENVHVFIFSTMATRARLKLGRRDRVAVPAALASGAGDAAIGLGYSEVAKPVADITVYLDSPATKRPQLP